MRAAWLLSGLLLAPSASHAADPSALWKIVSGQCVPHQESLHDPAPCARVELSQGADKGFAVLKDINGAYQFLLIPTARITGMEDPAILAPDAPNYWAAAWQARYFVEGRLHAELPRDAVALAINSSAGRTQDQLHIHIDCVRRDVHDTLAANMDQITDSWAPFPEPLAGHYYRAIRIAGETLGKVNPFRELADSGVTDLGMHTLVLVGSILPNGEGGFVLLDDHVNLLAGDRASGEQLQDHACSIAGK